MNTHALPTADSDYQTIRASIRYLSETGPDVLDLPRFARALGLTERQLTDLFRRWCGLSPKSFAQAVALDHAKSLLTQRASVLDTTFEVGLSSSLAPARSFRHLRSHATGGLSRQGGRYRHDLGCGALPLRHRCGHSN
ncbi:helix-turn-helix domain-containing protein [Devosia algicola]|uniref:Helix-turn-helix domain-containing protein n=1 Tax=Devosia algicola TaxID=3026418 RepID=A0ABY7YKX8_9HYPH|nr:helix-turn-helix domain-containing protein [Devosia algicola]WDR01813.1 helix-turn-helix domain-containing protein [Devosia algicola]